MLLHYKKVKNKSVLDKLYGDMIVISDMNEFTISTIHKWQQVISIMGSVHYAKVFHLDKRNHNFWDMEILLRVNIVALLYEST
jgi:hypothetical protein